MRKSILVAATLAGSGFGLLTAEKKADKNVLFIIVDDLNTTLGCYGHPVVKTPNIDRLASMGVQFNNAYCNYPVSGPSRSSFLTGLRPETTTILDNRKTLESVLGDRITLPYLFKQNGFYTMSIGKVFHGKNEENDMKAWDEVHGFGPTAIGKTGEKRNMTGGALKWCEWMAANGTDEDLEDGQNARKAVEFIKQTETASQAPNPGKTPESEANTSKLNQEFEDAAKESAARHHLTPDEIMDAAETSR